MLFTLKKYIGGMMLPLPLLLLLIALGLALIWFSRFQKSGKSLVTVGWLALLLLSLQPVADGLLRPIENTYPTWQGNQKVGYIVVLGGGYTWDPNWAPSSNLINNSLPRLNEGIRLWLANPESKMIFTGAAAKPTRSVPLKQEQEWLNRLAYHVPPSSRWIAQKIPKKRRRR